MLDQIDWRRLAEVLVKTFRLVDEQSVCAATFFCNHVHHRVPFGLVVAMMSRQCRRKSNRGRGLFERAQCNAPQAVFFVNDFALLRHSQAAVDGAGRRSEDSCMCLAAAPADCAAAAVEQGQFDALRFDGFDQRDLCGLQSPSCRRQATVFVAVRVTNHDHLPILARRQMFTIKVGGQQGADYPWAVRQIVNSLQQRCNVQRYLATARVKFAPLRKQQHGQYIIRPLRHADNKRTDGARAIFAAAQSDCLEYGDRLACQCGQGERRALTSSNSLDDSCGTVVRRALEPVILAEALADDLTMNFGVLAHVECNEVETEGFDTADEAPDGKQARMLTGVRGQAVGDQLNV